MYDKYIKKITAGYIVPTKKTIIRADSKCTTMQTPEKVNVIPAILVYVTGG